MVRDTLRNAVLALLAVVAVALTARTLPTAREQRQRGSGGSGAPGSGDGGLPTGSSEPLPQLLKLPFLSELIAVVGILFVLAMLVALFRHRRSFFRVAVVVVTISFVLAALLQLAPPGLLPDPVSSAATPVLNGSAGGGGGSASGTASGPSLLSVALLVVVGLAVLGTAVAANRRTRSDEGDPSAETETAADSASAVGRAAGRAADRIEETAELDNEVYRAFREMIVPLDVADPETTTAREFERAAVAAGMRREDVAALTDLFERARYDEYEVDTADEERAVELLRRIEGRYTEAEP